MRNFLKGFALVKKIGLKGVPSDAEKNKLPIFNLINFFAILFAVLFTPLTFLHGKQLSLLGFTLYLSPVLISGTVLWLNSVYKYEAARMLYFLFYPVLTAVVYITNSGTGVELFFIFYALLAVFMLSKKANIIICLSESLLIYSYLFLYWNNDYNFSKGELNNSSFYIFNQFLAMCFMFYFVFKLRHSTYRYQHKLLKANKNIAAKKTEVEAQLLQLKKQANELEELNTVKNKLFSVVAHDLKTPMYALRNLFKNMHQFDLPGDEIKLMIPDVVTDLNYTTGLMENLLQWAKSQMEADDFNPQVLDLSSLISEAMQLMRLQADNKKIYLENKLDKPVYIYADKNMVNLVLRNLLSNAIKFTPEAGKVIAGANDADAFVEVFVEDTGTGMDADTLQKVNANNYFSKPGTANEQGTGLGLMLCKDFLRKNGGRMFVECEPGKGSVFSFTLPVNVA